MDEEFVEDKVVSVVTTNPQVAELRALQDQAWNNPSCHIIWPGKELPKAIGNWDEGIMFVSALENVGKSSWIVQIITGVLQLNKDVAVLDISLDDSFRERTRRYLGVIAGVDTQLIARPILCSPHEKTLRDKAYDTMAKWMEEGRLEIKTQAEDEFSQSHRICDRIKTFCAERPDMKVIVIIDSWHDILMPEVKSDEPEKHVLQNISKYLKQSKALCIMTAHRRKPGGSDFTRKTSNDELKGSAYIKHYAKVMLALHNEVKARRENAEMFWTTPQEPEKYLPILEVSVQKNKTSEYDGWIFYYFQPASGRSKEVSNPDTVSDFRTIAIESLKYSRTSYSRT